MKKQRKNIIEILRSNAILIIILMVIAVYIIMNRYHLYIVKNFNLSNGLTISESIEKQYKTDISGVNVEWSSTNDLWPFHNIVRCFLSHKDWEQPIIFVWEIEGFEIRAGTNRTRGLTPELAPPCDTSDIHFDTRYEPFWICK